VSSGRFALRSWSRGWGGRGWSRSGWRQGGTRARSRHVRPGALVRKGFRLPPCCEVRPSSHQYDAARAGVDGGPGAMSRKGVECPALSPEYRSRESRFFSLPPRWRKGRGWWCSSGGAGRALFGAGASPSASFDTAATPPPNPPPSRRRAFEPSLTTPARAMLRQGIEAGTAGGVPCSFKRRGTRTEVHVPEPPQTSRSSSRKRGPRFTAGAISARDCERPAPHNACTFNKAWVLASARMSGKEGDESLRTADICPSRFGLEAGHGRSRRHHLGTAVA
jgi:hypothetical protein